MQRNVPYTNSTDDSRPKVPLNSHSDVNKILQIIKETDDEFRERECQLLDDIERKRKEDDIKSMEKELKKQKKLQAKLKKENEKAQRKRAKLEKDLQNKKLKEEYQAQKKMDEKLKKEREEEIRRMKLEAKSQIKKILPVDDEAEVQIKKEKQLAIEREMRQYNITPDVTESLPDRRIDTVEETSEEEQESSTFKDNEQSDSDTTSGITVIQRYKIILATKDLHYKCDVSFEFDSFDISYDLHPYLLMIKCMEIPCILLFLIELLIGI